MEKDDLTNEKVRKKFTNQFDLINYTITLATSLIRSGRSPRVPVTTDNPALQAIEELALLDEDEGKQMSSTEDEDGLTDSEEKA